MCVNIWFLKGLIDFLMKGNILILLVNAVCLETLSRGFYETWFLDWLWLVISLVKL